MTGIFVKAGFTCTACEGFVPLNALVQTITCPSCRREFELTEENWSSVLNDVIQEAPYLEEGEGTGSTIFGQYNMKLEAGRVQPRYSGTKDSIPTEEILASLDRGFVEHPKTGERTSIRRYKGFCLKLFPGIRAVIGEDRTLLSGAEEGMELDGEGRGNPIALQCPQCGGSLIVSGNRRVEKCRYCSSAVQLPHGLWIRLHPARKMLRWYILYDYDAVPFRWEEYAYDAVPLDGGDICAAFENSVTDRPVLVRLRSDGGRVWMRHDLDVQCNQRYDEPGMACGGGRIILRAGNGQDLQVLSAADGSEAEGYSQLGMEETETGEEKRSWNMKAVSSMTCLPDGSLVLHREYDDSRYCHTELVRLDRGGRRIPLWEQPNVGKEKQGFFEKLAGFFTSRRKPEVTGIVSSGNRPVRITDSHLVLAADPGGTLFVLADDILMAYDRKGIRQYRVKLPCRWIHGRPVPGDDGRVYVMAEEEGRYSIFMVSAAGQLFMVRESLSDSDDDDFDVLVRGSDGTLHVLGYDGLWVRLEEDRLQPVPVAVEG